LIKILKSIKKKNKNSIFKLSTIILIEKINKHYSSSWITLINKSLKNKLQFLKQLFALKLVNWFLITRSKLVLSRFNKLWSIKNKIKNKKIELFFDFSSANIKVFDEIMLELDFKYRVFFILKFKKIKDCISKLKYIFFDTFFLLVWLLVDKCSNFN